MTPTSDGPSGGNGPHPHGIAGAIDGGLQPCWQCGQDVGARALFCHGCGAVLPPRALDPFTRLGVEQHFDLDLAVLGRQLAGFTRALDPARFAARGPRQQANARAQAEAMAQAHATLHDPLQRARTLLRRAGVDLLPADPARDPDTASLAASLASGGAAAVDQVAAEAARLTEEGIRALADAFRHGRTGAAARLLARLEALEAVTAAALARRSGSAPPP
ncbi:molecular chaperone HscB [Azospirillum fermentarium]|uniref:molecular chaperone DnaJ n=1 Tax=Azospirillum fermentarium TaxID=1233114 RepID=UPI00222620AD|nr:molecular chaperone DnaJ [Azospirillum fermentarium]MCW2247018.1 molecular chaperone HscB [Azospirillum fermentarium]